MPSRALVLVTSRLCWIPLLMAASVICSLGTASVASADPCFTGGSPSGDPYTVPASGVSSVRISVNGQSGMPWRGVDSSGNLLAYNDGGLGSTLVADVPVTPGEVLQAGWLAGAAGGDSPDLANYYQNGTNTTYQGTDPAGTGGFAEYVTGSVNGACPIALAVAAGGGGGGAITGGGTGGNASWGSTGATPGGDGGSNNVVDGAGGGAATATAGGGSGAQGHSTNACHDGSSGAAGGFLSGGTGGAGSASVVDAQLNVYCNGGGGGGGGGAGYYGGGGGGSGYDDDPSGGGGGGESYVVSGGTVISAGASAVGGWFGFISPFDGGGCGCREKAVSGGATPADPSFAPHFATTVTLSSSPSEPPSSQAFTITASVNTPGDGATAAGGTVTLYNGGTGQVLTSAAAVVDGQATFSFPAGTFAAGPLPMYAVYSGYTGSAEIDEAQSSDIFDLTITQQLMLTPDDQQIAYGQSDPIFTFSVSGGISGDSNFFTTQPTCGVSGAHAVPGSYDITCTGGVVKSPYTLDDGAVGTLTVTKADQAITFISNPPVPSIVGVSPYVPEATGGGSGNGVTFSIDSSTTNSACSISNGAVNLDHAGTCAIDANQAGNANYNAAPQAQQQFIVEANAQQIVFTTTAPTRPLVNTTYNASAYATSSGPVTFTLDSSTTAGACNLGNLHTAPGQGVEVTTGTITFTGPGTCVLDANQSGTLLYGAAPQVQQTMTVAGTAQTITFNAPAGLTYGDADSSLGATASSGLPVSYTSTTPDVCTTANGKLHVVGAGSCTIDANQGGGGDVFPAPQIEQTFSIAKKTLHVDATPDGKTYGAADPDVTGDYVLRASDFVGSDTAAAVQGIASCILFTHGENVGTYAQDISCGLYTLTSANYALVQGTAADFTISKADQSITFTAPSGLTAGDPDLDLGATATSGLSVSYSSTTPDVCTIVNGKLHVVAGGPCTIDANQGGDANYNAASQVEQTFTITALVDQSISFPSPSGVKYGDPDSDLGATASSGLPVSYTSKTSSVCTIVSGKLHVVAAGMCTIDADQGGNGSYNAAPQVERTFSIAPKTVHVDATPDGKTYGTVDPNVTADYVLRAADFVGSDTAAAMTGAAVCSLASHGAAGGTYSGAITCTTGTLSAGNYTFVPGTAADFTISPANQSISFPSPSGVKYGDSDSDLGATASSGLSVSYTSKTASVCTIVSSRLHVVAAGQCTVDADQGGNGNYNRAPTMEQTFTIGKKAQAISFSSTPPSPALFGGTYTPAASGGASGNAVAFTIDPSSATGACWMLAGQVRFIGPGLCMIDANEPGNADYNAAPQKQQSLTIGFSKTLSGKVGSALTVVSGQAVYLAAGTAIGGAVTVQAGGALDSQGATISGPISSSGATAIRLCATKVSGTTTVTKTSGLIVAGDDDGAIACAGNSLLGSVSLTGNLGGVEFDGNTVSGSLTITGNTGLLPGPDSGTVDIVKNKVSGTAKTQS